MGDTNKDSKSNQVELTTIIRNVLDSEKWNLNEEKSLSADLTVDGTINEEDVSASVKYIVYGELEIPGFDQVDAPEIKAVAGTYDEEKNFYTSDVQVKITEKATNGKKTQYKVENSQGEVLPYTEITRADNVCEKTITLEYGEIYKVSAYTTGVLGNRSEIPYKIINATGVVLHGYKVKYYYDGVEDTSKEEPIKYVEAGTVIDSYPDKSEGYVLDTTKGNGTGVVNFPLTVSADETQNIIEVYYVSNKGNLVIHHYKDGATTPTKIAEDETVEMEYGSSYEVTPLFANNKIKVNGTDLTTERAYLDSNACEFSRVVGYEGTATGENGTVTGTATRDMGEISYYYNTVSYQVTGEVIGGNGSISLAGNPISVAYGCDVEDDIVITPDNQYVIASARLYSGSEIDGSYDETDGIDIKSELKRVGKKLYIQDLDELCNITENKHIVVTFAQSTVVCQIVDVPKGLDTMKNANGDQILWNEYSTLEEAIVDALLANSSEDKIPDENDNKVEIKILANINGENNQIDNDNIVVIDLNSYTISSDNSAKPTIEVKDGNLTVVDKSAVQTGKIENTEREAIKLNEGGSLTLGTNEESGEPSIVAPTIEGGTYGINKDPNGVFNFFDGLIIGNSNSSVSDSGVNETPDFYNAYTKEDPQGSGRYIEYLVVPSDVVAIVKSGNYSKEWTTLEGAFNDADELPEGLKVEIKLVRDVMVENESTEQNPIITIGENKDYTLDLNGHTITPKYQKNIFINNGKFEVKDSSTDYYQGMDLFELQHDSDYYFVKQGDYLVPNDQGTTTGSVYSSEAHDYILDHYNHSYVEIDLSDTDPSSTNQLHIEGLDFGRSLRWYVTESAEEPEIKYYPSGSSFIVFPNDYELEGGKKYYLHIIGVKLSGTGLYTGMDSGVITEITLNGKPIINELAKGTGKIVSGGTWSPIINNEGAELIVNNTRLVGSSEDMYMIENKGDVTLNHSYLDKGGIRNYKDADINGGLIRGTIYKQSNNDNVSITGDAFIKASGRNGIISENLTIDKASVIGSSMQANAFNIKDLAIGATTVRLYVGSVEDSEFYNVNLTMGSDNTVTMKNNKIICGTNDNDILPVKINGTATLENNRIYGYISSVSESKTEFKSGYVSGGRSAGTVIALSNSGEFTIDDGTFNGCVYNADYNINYPRESTLIIKGGTINGPVANYHLNKTSGEWKLSKIIIGTKNTGSDDEVSTTSPTINTTGYTFLSRDTYGIYNGFGGEVYFYDGQIITKDGYFISGNLTEIEDNVSIICDDHTITKNDQEIDCERTYLSKTGVGVAQILKTADITIPSSIITTEKDGYYVFSELNSAISCCNNSDVTIELINPVVMPNAPSTITSGKKITIDLKGNELRYIYGEEGINVEEGGKLTIKDSGENGKVTNYAGAIENHGEFNLESGKITTIGQTNAIEIPDNSGRMVSSKYATAIFNNGTMNLNGGTVAVDNNNNVGVVQNSGTLNLNGTPITGGIYNKDSGKLNINNSEIGYAGIPVYNIDTATVKMTGGKINSTRNRVLSNSTAAEALEMTGGRIECTVEINNGSKVKIAGTSDNTPYISDLKTNGYVNCDNGTIDRLTITDNYANITNSRLSGEITNSSENITTVDNSSISLTLKGTGTTNITKCQISSIINNGQTVTIDNDGAGNKTIKTEYADNINNVSGNLTIKNANIDRGYYASITNSGDGTITLENVKPAVDSQNRYTPYCVKNSGSGDIIIGKDCIVYDGNAVENSGAGHIYIGREEDEVSTTTPEIICKEENYYATYNSGAGSIIFNNGRITGKLNKVFYGSIEPRSGATIINTDNEDETLETKILGVVTVAKIKTNEATVSGSVPVVDGYYEFNSLQDAVNACNPNGTIYIIQDISMGASTTTVNVTTDDNITIDLSGHIISIGNSEGIKNKGTLKIIDSSENNIGSLTLNGTKLISNEGTLTIDNAVVGSDSAAGTAESHAIIVENIGTLNVVNGARVKTTKPNTTLIENSGTANVNASTLNGEGLTSYSIYNKDNGNVTLTNAEVAQSLIVNTGSGVINSNDTFWNIAGLRNGGISKDSASGTPTTTIAGGVIIPGYPSYGPTYHFYNIENYAGQVTLKNGTSKDLVVGSRNGYVYYFNTDIKNDGGTTTIESGKVRSNIINVSGTVKVLGGEINGGIDNKVDGVMEIIKGTFDNKVYHISSSDEDIRNGTVAFGERDEYSGEITNSGSLTIGNKADAIDPNSPTFTYMGQFTNANTATLNFYDGKIAYTDSSDIRKELQNYVDDIPDNASIIHTKNDVDEWNTQQVYQVSADTVVAKIGNTGYMTLKSAFAACTTNTQTTIDLQKSIVLEKDDIYTIGGENAARNIKLNLNNNTIKYNGASTLFTVESNSTFELTDLSDTKEGAIYTYGDILVDNKGTFTLSSGTYDILDNGKHQENTFIKNTGSGTVSMTGGKIINDEFYNDDIISRRSLGGLAINSTSSGNISISGGEIISSGGNTSTTDARIYPSNWIAIVGSAANKATQVNISGTAKITGGKSYYSYVYNRNSIHNITFNMSGGEINTSITMSACNVNVNGGSIDGTLGVDDKTTVNVDGTAVIKQLGVSSGTTKIYGGTITDLLDVNGNYDTKIPATVEIDGSKGIANDKVTIGKMTNVTTNTSIKHANITKGMTVSERSNDSTIVTLGEGVSIKNDSGDAIIVYNGDLYIQASDVEIESTNAVGLTVGTSSSTNIPANVYLGIDDATISRTAPVIKGKTAGISLVYRNAYLYWNDGVAVCTDLVTAANIAFRNNNGNVVIPERFRDYYGVKIINSTEEKIAYVGPTQEESVVAYIGDTGYTSLQEAVNSASATDTIRICSTVTLESQLVIGNNKSVTIDIAGNVIGLSNENELIKIESGATLTLKDSDPNGNNAGKIQNTSGSVINNNGTLNLQFNSSKLVPKDGSSAITGNGTVNN